MTRAQSSLLLALLALAVTLVGACSSTSNPTSPTPAQAGPATANVVLRIVSEKTGQPMADVAVRVENPMQSGITDVEGKVSFETIKQGARVEISYPDYLKKTVEYKTETTTFALAGPLDGLPLEFIAEFVFGNAQGGNTSKPRNNALDVILDDDQFRTTATVNAFQRVCQKIEAVGYTCRVHQSVDAIQSLSATTRGTLALFRYGGAEGTTSLLWQGAATDHTWTIRGDLRGMESEPSILNKLISPLGFRYHSWSGGGASRVQVSSDFSDFEKRAIALYMSRTEPTCYEDGVMLPVPGNFGALCGVQPPFGSR